MAKLDPAVVAHQEWIGYVQPIGLVVSAPALVRAGAILDRRDADGQLALRACVEERSFGGEPEPYLPDFVDFATNVLGWTFSPNGFAGTDEAPIPAELEVALSEYDEVLLPDFAVRELDPLPDVAPWQVLVRIVGPEQDLDAIEMSGGRLEASVHGRMERLLRQAGVTAGLLFNGRVIRLMSAPRGETSGWMDFRVTEMVQTGGRPICTALRVLLSQTRLLSLPRAQRLAALLTESRRFQNEVSERLAEQVLHALYELLRGFQSAHDASGGRLLYEPLRDDPDDAYRAMLTVIMRLVFLLYSEERAMLPADETFLRSYSVAGLYERLREDAALNPDTMGQRFGAWGQLLALFRLIFDGNTELGLPKRHGVLFDPDRFAFLEGRERRPRQVHERIEPPLVPDGTIYRVLDKLVVLDGERISYSALDVEQIGSVYEAMMGFRLEQASGRAVAIKPQKRHGAPSSIDLEALLEQTATARGKWLRDRADRKLTDRVLKAVKDARSVEDLHAALGPVIDAQATPDLVPAGAMILQPSAERRRSGSYYTPRSLTEPIVRTTLEPVLTKLREMETSPPTPEAILSLKVCDPAMGSAAFLVEACRQLADALIEAWGVHGNPYEIPPDEDEVMFARRLVAQRCLYGVDRNPMAVDLAKVALWLMTLARQHSLAFLDHALRHGDSLVGLSRRQIESFHWDPKATGFEAIGIGEHVNAITSLRAQIRDAEEDVTDAELHDLWDRTEFELSNVRLFGDLVVAAFFDGDNAKKREARRLEYADAVVSGRADEYRPWLDERRAAEPPLAPFHWEIEFPEVFDGGRPGFDAIVGNPPFGGKNAIAAGNIAQFSDWLKETHAESHGNADVVAHFFRRAFEVVRPGGAIGLIATKTIAQGDTRSTGLRWICEHGGEIFAARKRVKWPSSIAAVVVSVVHIAKGTLSGPRMLDGRQVELITAFLFHRGNHDDPARLVANFGKGFIGTYVLGMGFTFNDTDSSGAATPLAVMEELTRRDPRNAEVIFPYMGGEEVNASPTHAAHRYVINFGGRDEKECRESWPALFEIVEAKVKPRRATQGSIVNPARWWMFARPATELYSAIAGLPRVLVIPRVSMQYSPTIVDAGMVFSEQLVVFADGRSSFFCVIASRVHELWFVQLASTFGSADAPRYTPTDCFETFPLPVGLDSDPSLAGAGKEYYEFRADLMIQREEGMTKIYNRFHDPDERGADVMKLRELHEAMDRAVLGTYGWADVSTDCEFLLDYEDEEDGGRRKNRWRYRWPDEVREEVLARLLELNAARAREESATGTAASRRSSKRRIAESENLFS